MSSRRSRVWRWLLCVHLVIVLGLITSFAIVAALGDPEDGANIGAGLLLLPLLFLGVPWSVPAIIDPYQLDEVGGPLWCALTLGPALLNVGLHAAVFFCSRVLGSKRK